MALTKAPINMIGDPNSWGAPYKAMQSGVASIAEKGDNIVMANNLYNDGTNWRYITSGYGTLIASSAGDNYVYTAPSGTAGAIATPVLVSKFDANGTMILPKGQINFPATQNPSSDANTLDDYEEGTWTPVLSRTGTEVSATYVTQAGRYTKVGNLVTVTATITISACTAGSGYNSVIGLPFLPNASGLDVRHCGSVMYNTIFSTSAALRCGTQGSGRVYFMVGSRSEVEINEAFTNGAANLQFTVTYTV